MNAFEVQSAAENDKAICHQCNQIVELVHTAVGLVPLDRISNKSTDDTK